jgi:hypothetical protein
VELEVPGADRRLHGLLFSRRGGAFLFVEEEDDPAERRFTLAHELAHYLRDSWRPRRRARELLGEVILQVLDGDRPALPEERLEAVLRGVRVGHHTHFLARDERGRARGAEAEAEAAADRLAYELLAPADVVLRAGDRDPVSLARRLRDEFGLPGDQAGRYAARLCPPRLADPILSRIR